MGGGQIQNPQFAQTPQTQVAPTNVIGAYGMAQQGNLANYQLQQQQQQAAYGGAAGLAGTLAGAFLLG